MATIQRPLKTYGNRTYVAEVAAAPSNQDPILANEVDGDIDTMYSAWNGGADTVNIKDGAISRVKLSTTDVLPSLPPVPTATDANRTVVVNSAGTGLILGTGGTFAGPTPPATPQVGQLWWRNDPDGNLFIYYDDGNSKQFVPAVPSSVGPWSVSGSTLTPTDATKSVAVSGAAGTAQLRMGARTLKGRLLADATGDRTRWTLNAMLNAAENAWVQDDTAKAAWIVGLDSSADSFSVGRIAPTSGTFSFPLTLDSASNLALPSANGKVLMGSAAAKTRVLNGTGFDTGELTQNYDPIAGTRDDGTKSGVRLYLQAASSPTMTAVFITSAGAQTSVLTVDMTWGLTLTGPTTGTTGNLTINGNSAVKNTGTTWANPSDIRLKQDIGSYTRGLADILKLSPITYRLKADPERECQGFDAAAVQDVFPECVGTTRMKLDPDGEEEEVLTFDMHPVLVALVNAVKELAGKVGH